MKKAYNFGLLLLVILTVGLVMAACSSDGDGVKTERKEVLRVGGPDVLPYTWFRDENNELVGFDVDLAEIIAEKLDMELELQVINKDATIPSLQERKVDVLMGGMARTPEREKQIGFSDVYVTMPMVWVVSEESNISSLEDLEGKVIATQMGASQNDEIESIAEEVGATVKTLGSTADLMMDVSSGRSDIGVGIYTSYMKYAEEYGNLNVAFALEDMVFNRAIGTHKEDVELTEKINEILEELEEDGTIDLLKEEWFGNIDDVEYAPSFN